MFSGFPAFSGFSNASIIPIETIWSTVCNFEEDKAVRLENLRQLKGYVTNQWNRKTMSGPSEDDPKNWKNIIRENLVDILIQNFDLPEIFTALEEVARLIFFHDFTEHKTILEHVIEKLKDPHSFKDIMGVLRIIDIIAQVCKPVIYMRKEVIPTAIQKGFNQLLVLIEGLCSNYTEQSAEIINKIFDTVELAKKSGFHHCLSVDVIDPWFTVLKNIFDKPLPEEMTAPSEDQINDKRAQNAFWINKENCQKIIFELLSKKNYFAFKVDKTDHLSLTFLSRYALPFLKSFISCLLKTKTEYVPSKIQERSLEYIIKSFKFMRKEPVDLLLPWERSQNNQNSQVSRSYEPIPDFKQLILNHSELLMFDVLLPSLSYTSEDNTLWVNSPIDFIKNEENYLNGSQSPRGLAIELIKTICQGSNIASDGESCLIKFMKHVIQVLETNINPRTNLSCDLSYKEGILYVIGNLKETILNSEVQKDMETFMIKYVMPEINNENNIIRFRVVWLLGVYGDSVYSDSVNISNIIKYLCDRLGDNEIPIQVATGISLESFISRPEAKEIIKPCLDKIIERYLLLIEKVSQRQLINALREIIIIFKNDLVHLVEKLVELFTNAFFIANSKEEVQMEEEKAEEEEDEDDEGKKEEKLDNFKFVPIAEGYLILILEIVKSQTSKEILDQLENIIMPLLRYCLSDEGIEYVEYGLRILLPFLSQTETISENMWEFYPQLNYIFGGTKDPAPPKPDVPSPDGKVDQFKQMMEKFEVERKAKGCLGYADDFSDLIVPCLQNYIQKGAEIILTEKDPVFDLTYVGLLFRTIDKIKLKGSVDTVILHTLYFALLENYRGQIDEIMLQILEKSLDELLACKEYITQASLAETIVFCFWYNTQLALQLLEKKQLLERYFNFLFKITSRFIQPDQCQRLLLGLASILRGNVSEYSEVMLKFFPQILGEVIKISSKTLGLRNENEDKMEEEFEVPRGFSNTAAYILYGNFDEDEYDGGEYNVRPQGDYHSPLENQCEILYLKESLTILQQTSPDFYNQLIASLSEEEKLTLQNNIELASKRHIESEMEALPEQFEKSHVEEPV